ncbi:DUF3180 domain-containing protein [Actinocatenispora rupis]|uniref:Membrane protein n=1 Tax=Actinocatenispora rupis TaxID=519421 RepID=A0A8J3NFA3_9ACTN|nr:DUF3180 domain-containing protein [Actinocatenispora rupis]GID15037.1 membrane protein [Actinocatenispora rupis]
MNQEPEPRVRPTSRAMLGIVAVVAAVAGWLLFDRFYGDIPPLPLVPGITLVVLAVVEGIVARSTAQRIEHRPGTEPVNPLAVARYVLVAKASSTAGAIFAGLYGGALIWVLLKRGQLAAAADDVAPAVAGLVGSALLVAAALWLEHACRVPERPDDEDDEDR